MLVLTYNYTGRSELRIFFVLYLLTLPFQLIDLGSFLEQGSTALVVLTAIHAGTCFFLIHLIVTKIITGLVAALFWTLLANALVATQIVEDGTPSSIIVRQILFHQISLFLTNSPHQPISIFTVLFFVATTYISLDIGLTITSTFGPSNPPTTLHSIPLFVLTNIWPGA